MDDSGAPDAYARGLAYAAGQDPGRRTARGAWYTPPEVARRLVAEALSRWRGPAPPRTVLDPAAGAGAFLLAAHERLPAARLAGVDADPQALAIAREALDRLGADHHLLTGDGLDESVVGTADVVLGNPPFLSQLQQATSRDAVRRRILRARFGAAAKGYTDESALFLLVAARALRPGGVAVMVVPEAVLATTSAAAARAAVSAHCDVEVVWRDTGRAFPGVPTCAVALTKRALTGQDATAGVEGPAGGRAAWSALLAREVPPVHPEESATLGDIASATADFRDAYYLVADHVVQGAAGDPRPRITPVGLIDPAHHRWGETQVRFAKHTYAHPVAEGLPPAFLAARSGQKVLLATQTRSLEALVDEAGTMLPTTPVITIRSDRPWHVAAALTSPVLSAVAARRHAGAARSREALKLSARQVLDLPRPADSQAWDDAAETIRAAHAATDPVARREQVVATGRLMWAAFDLPVDQAATAWWVARLPRR